MKDATSLNYWQSTTKTNMLIRSNFGINFFFFFHQTRQMFQNKLFFSWRNFITHRIFLKDFSTGWLGISTESHKTEHQHFCNCDRNVLLGLRSTVQLNAVEWNERKISSAPPCLRFVTSVDRDSKRRYSLTWFLLDLCDLKYIYEKIFMMHSCACFKAICSQL